MHRLPVHSPDTPPGYRNPERTRAMITLEHQPKTPKQTPRRLPVRAFDIADLIDVDFDDDATPCIRVIGDDDRRIVLA
jgi:hypothetical protein